MATELVGVQFSQWEMLHPTAHYEKYCTQQPTFGNVAPNNRYLEILHPSTHLEKYCTQQPAMTSIATDNRPGEVVRPTCLLYTSPSPRDRG